MKKNKFLSFLVPALFVVALVLVSVLALALTNAPKVSAAITGGGSASDPFIISTLDDLKTFRDEVNAGDTKEGKVYKLGADIDLATETDWTPIGINAQLSFKGIFDGDGKTISNLNIGASGSTAEYVGFFGYVYNGEVLNLVIDGSANDGIANAVYGGKHVGGLAGYLNNGHIANCKVMLRVVGHDRVGGLVGMVNTSSVGIEKSSFVGMVMAQGTGETDNFGGIVGYTSSSRVAECSAEGVVKGRNNVGGVVGHMSGGATFATTENCFFMGLAVGANRVGGVVGDINSQNKTEKALVANVYATGWISGVTNVGGVAGFLYNGSLINSAALTDWVDATTSNSGRVLGGKNLGTVSGNVAFSRMLNDNVGWENDPGVGATAASLVNGLHDPGVAFSNNAELRGTNIAADAIKSDGTIGGLFTTPVWYVEDGRLPVFEHTPPSIIDVYEYLEPKPLRAELFDEVGAVTFTGSELEPAVTSKFLTAEDFEILDYTDNLNAGTGVVILSGKGNYTGQITLNFTINKSTPTYSLPEGLKATFGDQLSDVTLPEGWTWDNGAQTLSTVGDVAYAATYSPDIANFNPVGENLIVSVGKKAVQKPTIITGLKFDGTVQTGVNYDTTLTGYTLGGQPNYDVVTATNKGIYRAMFSLKPNYIWADDTEAPMVLDWTIGENDDATATVSMQNFTYGDVIPGTSIVTSSTGDWMIETREYSTTFDFTSLLPAAPQNAGVYYVRAVLTQSPLHNYADYTTAAVQFTIFPKSIAAVTIPAVAPVTYNGFAQTPISTIEGLTLDTDYTLSYGADNTGAGAVTVTIAGQNNYTGVRTLSFEILKNSVTVTPISGRSAVYGSGAVVPTFNASGLVGMDSVSTAFTGTLALDNENAGVHKIGLGTLASRNYSINLVNVTYEILKADQATPNLALGEQTTTTITAKAVAGAEYRIGDGELGGWQDGNVFENLTAGTEYVVQMRMKADDNHNASDTVSVSMLTLATDPSQNDDGGIWWIWIIIALLAVLIAFLLFLFFVKRKEHKKEIAAPYGGGTAVAEFAPIPFTLFREDILSYISDNRNKRIEQDIAVLPNVHEKTKHHYADTLYCGHWCFGLMYERANVIKLTLRLNEDYAYDLKQTHVNLRHALFPKGENWYDLIIDKSFVSREEVFGILDVSFDFVLSKYYKEEGGAFVTDVTKALADEKKTKTAAIAAVDENDSAYDAVCAEYRETLKNSRGQ